jgi:hypothetical protein
VLALSDFKLSEPKTMPEGVMLYLSLPQRYMDTHYRWLRMMVALTPADMEITRAQPRDWSPGSDGVGRVRRIEAPDRV